MRKHFRASKRKPGISVLVVTCLVTAGWIRSASRIDFLRTPSVLPTGDDHRSNIFGSWSHSLVWMEEGGPRTGWLVSYPSSDIRMRLFESPFLEWKWQRFGFGRAVNAKTAAPSALVAIPYIVISLTLVSAWLLLSRPRKLNPLPAPA